MRNPLYEVERDEWLAARAAATEMDRAAACRHRTRSSGVCPECGDDIKDEA